MLRTNEIKSIMRKLREDKPLKETKNESAGGAMLTTEASETENDTSEADLLLARLEDIISRFEKALTIADDSDEDEEPAAENEETADEDEEPAAEDEEPADEDEESAAEESYQRSLEERISALERRFTESRRRNACRRFSR